MEVEATGPRTPFAAFVQKQRNGGLHGELTDALADLTQDVIAIGKEIKASAGAKGELTIPTAIMLLVAPFIGEAERQIVARLRYRINDGALRLSYHLDRPHVVIRDALDGVHDTLAAEFANTYVGEPAP